MTRRLLSSMNTSIAAIASPLVSSLAALLMATASLLPAAARAENPDRALDAQ